MSDRTPLNSQSRSPAGAPLPPRPTFPGLKHSKSHIRPYLTTDAPALAKLANNPLISRFMRNRFPSPYTLKDAENWIALCHAKDPCFEFCIAHPETNEPMGGIGLMPTSPHEVDALSWEVGYWLGEPFWGDGIMTECVREFVNWAMREVRVTVLDGSEWELQRIHAEVFGENLASQKLLRKVGFVLEGIKKRAVLKGGRVMDVHVYAITRGEDNR